MKIKTSNLSIITNCQGTQMPNKEIRNWGTQAQSTYLPGHAGPIKRKDKKQKQDSKLLYVYYVLLCLVHRLVRSLSIVSASLLLSLLPGRGVVSVINAVVARARSLYYPLRYYLYPPTGRSPQSLLLKSHCRWLRAPEPHGRVSRTADRAAIWKRWKIDKEDVWGKE
jgi:hypothetical protein